MLFHINTDNMVHALCILTFKYALLDVLISFLNVYAPVKHFKLPCAWIVLYKYVCLALPCTV